MGHDEAVKAYEQNISALAIAAKFFPGGWVTVVSVMAEYFRSNDRILWCLSRFP
ncbi:Inner membrane transport protein YhaO [Proteus mirabilis]|uniref:Inner membrane transport protein YhaO n=1 Tax=Proteus mirabilis TaxID=584 RepID=A0A2X2BM52_PROMI|nr:Inner membrane transport protein YhaO [Proteus mirabilis]